MAVLENQSMNTSELVVQTPATMQTNSTDYVTSIREVDATAGSREVPVTLPTGLDFKNWAYIQRVALLKRQAGWKSESTSIIMLACIYSDNYGLDIIAGDVYVVDGRLNTTTGAKIKYALNSGKIRGFSYNIQETKNTFTYSKGGKQGEVKQEVSIPDLICEVQVEVVGWENPFIYKHLMSEWFKPSNPNWIDRTEYMLSRSAIGHALSMVVPLGSAESDEAPPIIETITTK